MTHEQRAPWIRRIFSLCVIVAVITAALCYHRATEPVAQVVEQEAPPPIEYDMEVIHYHLPGKADSDQLATSLDELHRTYESRVLLTRVDLSSEEAAAIVSKLKNPPYVVMMVGEEQVYSFRGEWPKKKIEFKIDQILHGLETVDENWLPEVKGMQRAASARVIRPEQPASM